MGRGVEPIVGMGVGVLVRIGVGEMVGIRPEFGVGEGLVIFRVGKIPELETGTIGVFTAG
jgi:hypothetical protein